MLRQIRYFQSVVRNNSFSGAAEECHIFQSAISQQIQALERELGFALLERRGRKFALTPAGEYFYQKSLVLLADLERLRAEAAKIAGGGEAVLRIGFPRCYGGEEFHRALERFSEQYPEVTARVVQGNHEELLMRTGNVDIAMNDQRRAFSGEYVNLVLAELPLEIEVAVLSGKGFLPIEGGSAERFHGLTRVPVLRDGSPILRTYCAFWLKAAPPPYAAEFAAILKEQF